MNERTMKLRLGAAVVLSVVIIIIFLSFLGSREKFAMSSYQIKIQLIDAPNVVENTPIYQSGILIGRVSGVELTENNGVLVTARIYNDHQLYHDQECHLTSSLLGDASLRMISVPAEAGKEANHAPIKPGEVIQGRTSLNAAVMMAQMQEKLSEAIDDVTSASAQLATLAVTTNEMLGENRSNVKDIMGNARSITANSSRIVQSFSEILDEEFCKNLQTSVGNLREASEKMPGTLDKVNNTLASMQDTINNTNRTINTVNGRIEGTLDNVDGALKAMNATLTNLQKITKPFTDEKVSQMWISNITNILRNMDTFTETLNRHDSTIGLLMNDRAMFDRMQSTMEQINELPRKLDPILFNAQVMTEKLAQHPELLGLRGYLKKDNGTSREIPWPKGISPYSPSSAQYVPQYNSYSGYYSAQPTTPPVSKPATQPILHPAVKPTQPATNSILKPASQSSRTLKPAVSTQCTPTTATATRPLPQSGEVTPEMLGMTPEEFKNASVQVLSDAVWDMNTDTNQNTQNADSDTIILPPAMPPLT